ncbi:MAG: hypothetical protein JO121_27440 [Deltaproteobacteria bacterium]|nr:hypothetical protein [Deltaproteobacteria bacterium]
MHLVFRQIFRCLEAFGTYFAPAAFPIQRTDVFLETCPSDHLPTLGDYLRPDWHRPLASQELALPAARLLRDNQRLFDLIARQIQNKVVLYLEFGVFEGNSVRYWSKLLENPGSMLHGFDSFEGLP